MSFANKWLRYLESRKRERVNYIALYGDRPEDMPYTKISFDKGKIKQTYFPLLENKMEIPDKIGIDPIDVKTVEIKTLDGLTFHVLKPETGGGKPKIKMRHVDSQGMGLSFDREKVFVREAKNLGYEVVEFMQTDV